MTSPPEQPKLAPLTLSDKITVAAMLLCVLMAVWAGVCQFLPCEGICLPMDCMG